MRRIIAGLIFLCLLPMSISCKTKYDFRNAVDAADKIVEEIKSRKIIFIGDNHNDVFILYFLAENLEKFYNAGVRYIFLEEESDNYIENPEQPKFFIYPPWATFGDKFEYRIFEDEIIRINKLHSDDPLIPVWPETGLVLTDEDLIDTHQTLNKRDKYSQQNIINIMDSTDKKAMIFYGDGHGQKKPTVWDSNSKEPYWKTMGCYLDEYYGSDFCTFDFFAFDSDKYKTVFYSSDDDCKVIPEKTLKKILKADRSERQLDYYCVHESAIYGVPNCYVPEKGNLNFMISLLDGAEIPVDKKIDVGAKKSEQLLAIYYLKYHLDDKFDFDYTCSQEKLWEAIANLKREDLESLPYDLKELEKYMELIHSFWDAGSIEDCIFYINQAKEMNPRDIWGQYWLSWKKTADANDSGKSADYEAALREWEELLQNDFVYASPVVKLVYQKAALCAEKSGDGVKAEMYRKMEKNLNPIFDIDYEGYFYFGY